MLYMNYFESYKYDVTVKMWRQKLRNKYDAIMMTLYPLNNYDVIAKVWHGKTLRTSVWML